MTSQLASLFPRDISAALPRARWSIGQRVGMPIGATLHYNGPAVAQDAQRGDGLIAQLCADVRWQMRPGGLGAPSGGDGLQYHFVVDADGVLYQTRSLDAVLWHCRNGRGNTGSLAIHLPLGGTQDATTPQWATVERLLAALMADYGFGRSDVLGHQEWPGADTVCPGPLLMARLRRWRTNADRSTIGGMFRVRANVSAANVRQGPGTTFPVAHVFYPGDLIDADAITSGQVIDGDSRWPHLRTGLGFVHMSLLEAI